MKRSHLWRFASAITTILADLVLAEEASILNGATMSQTDIDTSSVSKAFTSNALIAGSYAIIT